MRTNVVDVPEPIDELFPVDPNADEVQGALVTAFYSAMYDL